MVKKTKPIYIDEKTLLGFKQACFATANARKTQYDKYRSYYYRGSQTEDATVKRLFGEVNTLASLVYTPENIIFDITTSDVEVSEIERKIFDKLHQLIKYNFYTYNRIDEITKDMIRNALICGTSVAKIYWDTGSQSVLLREVLPENFGVAYETLEIDHQSQVLCHKVFLPKRTVEHRYKIDLTTSKEEEPKLRKSPGLVIPMPSGKATVDNRDYIDESTYMAQGSADMVEVYELWLNDKDFDGNGDWLKYTFVEDTLVSKKPEVYHKLRHPFYTITPYKTVNSVYGYSVIELLKNIQERRNYAYYLIDNVTELKAMPPVGISGMNLSAEQVRKEIENLYTPRGSLIIQDPNARIQQLPPQVDLSAVYAEIDKYDQQVKYLTGLTEVVMGEQMKGVRSSGHAGLLAAFASTPLREKSNTIESQLEEIFTHMAYLYVYNYRNYVIIDGKQYFINTIPYDFKIEIRSFTTSPIELRETQSLAKEMFANGLIPFDVFLEIVNLPFADKIKEHYKKMQQEKAMMAVVEAQKDDQKKDGK